MKLIKPQTRQALLTMLGVLRDLIEQHEVEKSCASCTYYDGKMCGKFEQTPPEHVVKAGCQEWEWTTIPF